MRGRGTLFPPTDRYGDSHADTPPSFSEQAARRPMQVFLFNTASPLTPPHTHTHTHAVVLAIAPAPIHRVAEADIFD